MEFVAHLERRSHPDIARKDGVHRAPQGYHGPLFGNPNAGGLAEGVHAGIGTAGTEHCDVCLAQPE